MTTGAPPDPFTPDAPRIGRLRHGWGRPLGLKAMVVTLLLLATIPVLLAVAAISVFEQYTLNDRARRNFSVLGDLIASHQQQLLESAGEVLTGVAATAHLLPDAEACTRYVRRLKSALPNYSNIGIASANGTTRCQALGANATDISDRAYFRRAMERGQLALGELITGRIEGKPIINLGLPIKADDGAITGVAFLSIGLKTLAEQLRGLEPPLGSSVYITDGKATVLATIGGDERQIGHPLADPVLRRAIERRQPGAIETDEGSDRPLLRVLNAVPLRKGDGLFVALSADKTTVLAPVVRARMLEAGLTVLILAGSALAIWLLAQNLLVRPLVRSRNALRQLGSAGFSATLLYPRSRVREIAMIQQGLQRMANLLERRQRQRDRAVDSATGVRQEVSHILERITDGFLVLDPASWTIKFSNERAADLLQRGRDVPLKGQIFWQLLPDDSDSSIRHGCERALRKGRSADFEKYYPSLERWFELRVFSTGSSIGVFVRDSTERRQTLDALQEREARYRELFDANPQVMWVFEIETLRFLAVNDATVARYGYRRDEFLAMTIEQIHVEEDLPELLEYVSSLSSVFPGPSEHRQRIWRHRLENGDVILVESQARAIEFDGKPAKLVLVTEVGERLIAESRLKQNQDDLTRELTEKKRDLDLAGKVLDSFSYLVSHDLRSPLQVIDGFAHELQDKHHSQLGEQGAHYVSRIRAAAQHMAKLIQDMLLLSRVTKVPLRHQEVDLSALADEIVTELREGDAQHSPTVEIDSGLVVHGDAELLRLVMKNLIGNAWKFTSRRDDAWIHVGYKPEQGTFYVMDNGAGFDMTYADKLFVAFQRLHSTLEFPGTGVGLAIAHRIVSRHGGEMRAESELGVGSTFTFTLTPSATRVEALNVSAIGDAGEDAES